MYEISLERNHSFLALGLIAGIALLFTAWMYSRIGRDVSPFRALLLLFLRVVAIVLLLLLIFRPVLNQFRDITEKQTIVLVVDTSGSMELQDNKNKKSRLIQACEKILGWWEVMEKDFNLRLLEFSGEATELEGLDELPYLKPTGQVTSLTQGLISATQGIDEKNVAAVILFSDGIHNAASDPLQAARQAKTNVYTIGVGSNISNNPSYQDVQVSDLNSSPQIVLNNLAQIKANIESVGMKGRVLKVQLEEDGNVIEQKDITLKGGKAPQEVVFEFLPKKKGRHYYSISVPSQEEEEIHRNNKQSMAIQVIDEGIRVLYLEGALRAEYGALVNRFLSKDPDIEFCALVQGKQNVFLKKSNMPGLKLKSLPTDPTVFQKFNVFILGNLDSSFLKPQQMELIVKRVEEGAGFLMIGGTNSLGPGGYKGTPLEKILPVFLGDRSIGQIADPFLPELTGEGSSHLIFTNIDKFFPTPGGKAKIKDLPALQGCVKVSGRKDSATVLAFHPTIETPHKEKMPVLAVQPFQKGRTAVFTGDTTRAWQQVQQAQGRESPFIRFWGQLVRWLANRNEPLRVGASVKASTNLPSYKLEEPFDISAEVRDKNELGTNEAKVKVRIKTPQGKEEFLPMKPVSKTLPGAFKNTDRIIPKSPGTYQVLVEAEIDGKKEMAEPILVEVASSNLEFAKLNLNSDLLEDMAQRGKGRYFHISTADELLEILQKTEQSRRVFLEQPLYFPKIFWFVLVGVLVLEWLLRKRYQLR